MDFFTSLFTGASAPTRKNTVSGATASHMNAFKSTLSPNVEQGVKPVSKNNVVLPQPGGRRTRRSRSKKMRSRK
jgi:hypothetical protein